MTRGYNEKTSRLIVHNWNPSPTPLNPTLMRSACGRAYAYRSAIVETLKTDCRCKGCEKKHPSARGESDA